MKKGLFTAFIIVLSIFLISCSSSNEEANKENDEQVSSSANNNGQEIDERREIINMIEGQKELLKHGFITDEYPIIETTISLSLDEDGDLLDRLRYESWYELLEDSYNVQYSNEPEVCEDGIEEWAKYLEVKENFSYQDIEGIYGYSEELGSAEIYLQKEDQCYRGYLSQYEELNLEIFELVSKTFKTEEEGAYEPFYSRFTLDLDKIKFPSFDKEQAEMVSITMDYSGNEDSSRIWVGYRLDNEYFPYIITDEEPMVGDQVNELEANDGTTVTIYEDAVYEDRRIYVWIDHDYYYVIEIKEDQEISEEFVLEVVDSSVNDERTFDNLDFFKGNERPNLGEDEQALEEWLRNY